MITESGIAVTGRILVDVFFPGKIRKEGFQLFLDVILISNLQGGSPKEIIQIFITQIL
jgi:hypothetical protein